MLAGKLRAATAGGAGLSIEDLFSTYLYEGNGSTQTITNGIDLAGEGGLVWIKNRDQTDSHILTDTERGATEILSSDSTAAGVTDADTLTAFNSDGFAIGADIKVNTIAENYASWTFRKAPRFFDVVTYTGTGVARSINHNLGIEPGFIITFEITGVGGPHRCWHRSLGSNGYMPGLDLTSASASSSAVFNGVTDTVFNIGGSASINESGINYVAYLFAHNDGDGKFGPNGDQDIIKCGSYIGNSTTDGPTVELGFEPQWILIKNATDTAVGGEDWYMFDNMRGITTGDADDPQLFCNKSDAEQNSNMLELTPTGFKITRNANYNPDYSGATYIYIAIRRGPMRQPESGTEVFDAHYKSGYTFPTTVDTGFVTDAVFHSGTTSAVKGLNARLTTLSLPTYSALNEGGFGTVTFDYSSAQDGFTKSTSWGGSGNQLYYSFRRAPGFFDVVAYTGSGNSSGTNLKAHNLTVPPEMVIGKNRSLTATNWHVWHKDMNYNVGESYINKAFMSLNSTAEATLSSNYWSYNDNPQMDADYFSLGSIYDETNNPSHTYIAYLFASLPGISKVGSYTGNGSSQTINCGFTTGARFILIKRTDSTGDWYVWDTARGIVTGDDPHLSLNTTAAEVTNDDSIDPDSSGFIVNQVAATNINVSSASYIYLAIS